MRNGADVRVIAGIAKGRRLTAPPGERTRPTGDRVKEALFSSLQPRLAGASVIDVFAGSGALGIEALSRGAAHATFIERARPALAALRQNLETTGLTGAATVVAVNARTALAAPPGAPFDVALLDPPYAIAPDDLALVLELLSAHLAPAAIVTVELDRRGAGPRWPRALLAGRTRRYGDTVLHLAHLQGEPADRSDG